MDRIASRAGVNPPQLSKEALDALKDYSFPGNVRQLENILERAFTLSDQKIIRAEDLLLDREAAPSATAERRQHSLQAAAPPPSQTTQNYPRQFDPNLYNSLDEFLRSIEKETIERTLIETRWNKTAAAQKLGISFRSLRYRLKKLGLEE